MNIIFIYLLIVWLCVHMCMSVCVYVCLCMWISFDYNLRMFQCNILFNVTWFYSYLCSVHLTIGNCCKLSAKQFFKKQFFEKYFFGTKKCEITVNVNFFSYNSFVLGFWSFKQALKLKLLQVFESNDIVIYECYGNWFLLYTCYICWNIFIQFWHKLYSFI